MKFKKKRAMQEGDIDLDELLKKNLKLLDYALALELCDHTEDNSIALGDSFDTVIQKIKRRN